MSGKLMIIYCLFACLLTAQDRSMGTLPLVQNDKPSIRNASAITNSPEYFAALNIFNRLVQARGDFRLPVPKLTMRNTDRNVAFIDYSVPEVILETKAYKVCESFGEKRDAAIAFLLGHELTHYYEKHSWRREFIYDYRDLPIGKELADLSDDVVHETEADYIGGFLAYSAGYGLFDQSSDLIQELYKAYRLPDTISGYPTLQDRKILSKRSAEKLSDLVDVFESANLLHATGYDLQALQFYNHVLQQYASRELYNNLGVTALVYARKLFSASEMKFRFFPELDLESSIQTRGENNQELRLKYIRQSILLFDASISLDPDYAPAYYNKAIAYALLKDFESARFYAGKEALQRTAGGKFEKTAQDISLLLATLDAMEGQTEKAKATWEELSKAGHLAAQVNLDILNNVKQNQLKQHKSRTKETAHTHLNAIEKALIMGDDLPVDTLISQEISADIKLHKNGTTKEKRDLKIIEVSSDSTYSYLIFYEDQSAQKSNQSSFAGKMDPLSSVLENYGQPHHLVETPNGRLLVYHDQLNSGLPKGKVIEINTKSGKINYIYFKHVIN